MILRKEEFSMWVEKTRASTKESYMDTVLSACDRFNVEIDLVQPLLSQQIVMKIKSEAINRRIMKTTSKSLKSFL